MNYASHKNIWCANERVGAGNIPGACPRSHGYQRENFQTRSSIPVTTCASNSPPSAQVYNEPPQPSSTSVDSSQRTITYTFKAGTVKWMMPLGYIIQLPAANVSAVSTINSITSLTQPNLCNGNIPLYLAPTNAGTTEKPQFVYLGKVTASNYFIQTDIIVKTGMNEAGSSDNSINYVEFINSDNKKVVVQQPFDFISPSAAVSTAQSGVTYAGPTPGGTCKMITNDYCGSPQDWFGPSPDCPDCKSICDLVYDCSNIEPASQYENNCSGYSKLIQNICADLDNIQTGDPDLNFLLKDRLCAYKNTRTKPSCEFIQEIVEDCVNGEYCCPENGGPDCQNCDCDTRDPPPAAVWE
jgi:hypothetical protein